MAVLELLNEEQGSTEEEKLYKKAFLVFYRWFMRKAYSLHILTNDKITVLNGVDRKMVYFGYKNKLVYLPKLKKKGKKETDSERRSMNENMSEFDKVE